MSTSHILEVSNLKTYFYVHEGVRKALDGASLKLQQGEILGVVGQSGSGKSVLARSIMGIINPPGRIVEGEINYKGRNLIGLAEEEYTELRGKDIALIVAPARSRLNPLLPVGKQIVNVIRAKQDINAKVAMEKTIHLLSSVHISDPKQVAKMYPSELSGGMCQRVLISMALSNDPKLLLADEPISGLDVTVQLQIFELLTELVNKKGTALLLMTRDLGVLAHFTNRIMVLKDGRVVEEKETRSFFANPQDPYSKDLLDAANVARGASGNL